MICKILLLGTIALLLSGCGRPPASIVSSPPETPVPALEPSGISIEPAATSSPETASPLTPTPTATQPKKYEAYTRAYRELQQIPAPAISHGSGLPDPNALTGYLNSVGAGLRQLQAQKTAIENSLAPGEKKAWKTYQRELQEGGDQ